MPVVIRRPPTAAGGLRLTARRTPTVPAAPMVGVRQAGANHHRRHADRKPADHPHPRRSGGGGLHNLRRELRVRGTEGLRVADTSVMLDLVGGNINVAVIMVAEKAADLIRGRTPPAAVNV
ncbi:hypothetical protein KSF81_26840 [Siccirubricoccus sp. G192]|nr:hypothetical protein [Siccirubricoccus sp. G192]